MITVKVNTLKTGDKFVLPSYSEKFNHLYIVVETSSDGWADCVELHSGKSFTFGSAVPVVPVVVNFNIEVLNNDKIFL